MGAIKHFFNEMSKYIAFGIVVAIASAVILKTEALETTWSYWKWIVVVSIITVEIYLLSYEKKK